MAGKKITHHEGRGAPRLVCLYCEASHHASRVPFAAASALRRDPGLGKRSPLLLLSKRSTYLLWCLSQSKVLYSNSTAQRYYIKCTTTVCGVRAVELLVRVYCHINITLYTINSSNEERGPGSNQKRQIRVLIISTINTVLVTACCGVKSMRRPAQGHAHARPPRCHDHHTCIVRQHGTRRVHALHSARGEEQPAFVAHLHAVLLLRRCKSRKTRQDGRGRRNKRDKSINRVAEE